MTDFFQNGVITTFHNLGTSQVCSLEEQLKDFSRIRPIALVLPSLYREYASGALANIMQTLKKASYLYEIILCLDRCTAPQFKEIKNRFASFKKLTLIWNDGPRLKKLYQLLDQNKLSPGDSGKGRAVWIAMGYVLARGKSQVIAVHDCDIVNYDQMLLARLCYPVANPHHEYEFCKGYYSRVNEKMYGRATRLFFTPFVRALQKILGYLPFLVYIDSFRYPLAGEIAMRHDLAMAMRIPSDWGLEVGTLAEVYRSVTLGRISQVDIADTYEHKHQPLSANDPSQGITKMTVDITKSIYRTLAGEGVEFSEGFFKSLENIYLRMAQEAVVRYENDAAINCLKFDRHSESTAVEAFSRGIQMAGERFWQTPSATNLIPNWHRVIAAMPGFFSQLKEAVQSCNETT